MFRRSSPTLEVLLVHPGGPFWKNKDAGAWSIPKGLCEQTENPLDAAQREFTEETGFQVRPPLIPLGTAKQPGGKSMTVWAFEGDADPATLVSNFFEMEWPPRSGALAVFPEVDRAAWFDVYAAKSSILKGQVRFIDELAATLFPTSC